LRYIVTVLFCLLLASVVSAQSLIIDHTCTDISQIPESAIEQAKTSLHITYGHTSHGSQLTTGMTGLIGFANGGGLGLNLPENIFQWNNGGTGGALELEEGDGYGTGWMDHDCGYYPNWVDETREYLIDPIHADVNVVIWSWCGQASSYTEQQMIDRYLSPMTQLELDYPGVTFVYMTGHADGNGETGNLHLRNQQIRNYCIANNKVLYDFYDIEIYDPDGNYYSMIRFTHRENFQPETIQHCHQYRRTHEIPHEARTNIKKPHPKAGEINKKESRADLTPSPGRRICR
jgi:hypothetical protein